MKAYALALSAVLFCSGCVELYGYGRPEIRGAVLDSMTNMPVPNAQVAVARFWPPEDAVAVTTDAAGQFGIPRRIQHAPFLPPTADHGWTDARVIVSAPGYADAYLALTDLSGGPPRDVTIRLAHR